MTRRKALSLAIAAPAFLPAVNTHAQTRRVSRMGGTPSAFSLRAQSAGGGTPFDIVDHCHTLGLRGVQTSLKAIELDLATKLGRKIKTYGMELVLDSPPLPVEEGQLYRFDFALNACKAAGAKCLRVALADRRYEQFDSVTAFQRSFERLKSNVSLALPMIEKNKIRLAIENHGDWRSTELADWVDRLGCEYVGVCFDFAESLALCENPADSLRTLTPYIFMAHIKDVAAEPYQDGFAMSEVPLGDGMLDLKEMVRALRAKDPNMPIYLDAATRDPVKVPVSTEKYRAAFGNYSPLPEKDVANTLDVVRKNPPKKPLLQIAGMAPAAAVKREDECVSKSMDWARKNLDL